MKSKYTPGSLLAVLFLGMAIHVAALGADAQMLFDSPDDAVKALLTAVKAKDKGAAEKLFGPDAKELANPDAVDAAKDWEEFGKNAAAQMSIANENGVATLNVGPQNWPFPIPMKMKDGKWFFDTAAGKDEILNRRVGGNELDTIKVCREFVTAQHEYALVDHNGDGVLEYAQKIKSTAGKKDGLYWDAKPEEEQSPFGELAAKAFAEGYGQAAKDAGPQPFRGYYFKILTKQGAHAPAGKIDYVINGHMLAGFALLAYPAQHGNSGIMTFIVSKNGKVMQKNLGEKTKEAAEAMDAYDPDETWAETND